MIIPHIRSSFDRADARFIVWLLTRGSEAAREREEARLREYGFDAILDDPRTLNALLAGRQFSTARPELVFYVLVRHALLEDGINDRGLADYLCSDFHARGRPSTAHALSILREMGAGEQAGTLTAVNPARLLEGEPPVPVEPIPRQTGLMQRLRQWLG